MSMPRHHRKVETSEHPSEPAPTAPRRAKRVLRAFGSGAWRLLKAAYQFACAVLSASRKLILFLLRPARPLVRGLFPPLGIVSLLLVAWWTVGLPTGRALERVWPAVVFVILAVIFGLFLYRTSRERLDALFANTFGWLPVFLGALSYWYWVWYAHQIGGFPRTEFFLASAEVLPVLLLAAVVDVRRTQRLQSNQLILPITAVFLGELAALNALAFGNAGPYDFAAVASSFVSSIVALVLAVMADIVASDAHESEIVERSSHSSSDGTDTEEPKNIVNDQSAMAGPLEP
jgi:hypothetical protein